MGAAGCTGGALEAYAAALDVGSEYLPAIQALARLLARGRSDDQRLGTLLDEVALKGTDEAWWVWAGEQRARRR